jgi:Asp-tRNA(Asn)/Glu-tRNA(Gln) amidotransferase A subunit family amidase
VKHDVVVVLPVTPSPPPRLDAPAAVLQSWLSRCHAFAALTALGGVPSVVVPVGQLPQGGGPLTVGLFGHSRSDTRLITVAEKLTHAAQVSWVGLGS